MYCKTHFPTENNVNADKLLQPPINITDFQHFNHIFEFEDTQKWPLILLANILGTHGAMSLLDLAQNAKNKKIK